MRWKGGRRSQNVEDRRGGGGRRVAAGGGLVGLLIVVVVGLMMGKDPMQLLQDVGAGRAGGGAAGQADGGGGGVKRTAEEQELADFVSVVLADTEDTWKVLFRQQGLSYREPKLVLFSGRVDSACGAATASTGPFYCPADETIYIDLAFYADLKKRFRAPGDFAQAYVIAHEVGHHVQNLLGTSRKVQSQRRQVSKKEYNQLSVRLELQADFFAGVWAHHAHKARNIIESGDIEEALTAASAIGDDRLQKQSQGYVVPDSFTHGSSAQRVRWFRRGLQSGKIQDGDTFGASEL